MNSFFQWLADLMRGFTPFITIAPWELAVRIRLGRFVSGLSFDFVSITDFAVVKTFRLLQETGRNGVWGGNESPQNGKRMY